MPAPAAPPSSPHHATLDVPPCLELYGASQQPLPRPLCHQPPHHNSCLSNIGTPHKRLPALLSTTPHTTIFQNCNIYTISFMNRIVRIVYTKAVNCPRPSQGFSVLQNEVAQTPMKSQFVCRRNPVNVQFRNFSSSSYKRDERSIEEEAERKIGWLLKIIFAGTATVIGYNIFPYLGDNLMQQSVSLLHVKDPLFKRMGASRLARFAIDDKQRMKIVEMGGAKELVNMLAAAKDDRTRKEALKALAAISKSDEAVGALHVIGAIPVVKSIPISAECDEIEKYKLILLSRFQELKYDIPS